MERARREFLSSSSQTMKMESNFDATSERECSVCLFDLHLSAVGCHCSSDRYACLIHAKNFCSCAWGSKFFLYRYDTSELNILVEALEGKLSAVYRWARLDLGLALSSFISRDNMDFDKLSHSMDGPVLKNVKSQPLDIPVNSTGIFSETSFQQKRNPAEAFLPLKDMKASSTSHSSSPESEIKNYDLKLKTEQPARLPSNLKFPAGLLSQKDRSYSARPAEEKCTLKKPSVLANDNVILLSDDEGDKPEKPFSKRATDGSVKHSEPSERGAHSGDKANGKDPTMFTPKIEAGMLSHKDLSSSPDLQRSNCLSYSMQLKDTRHPDGGIVLGLPNFTRHVGSTSKKSGGIVSNSSISKEPSNHKMANVETNLQHLPPCDTEKPNNEVNLEKMGPASTLSSDGNVRANAGNSTCSQNNLDKYFRQKGPRIAKVVRRINCSVEPLEYGVVLSGKLWCNSRSIFPKGLFYMEFVEIINPDKNIYAKKACYMYSCILYFTTQDIGAVLGT